MIETTHEIPTPDGTLEAWSVHPDAGEHGQGPWPPVVLYMDAPGIREELREFCRRIAREGYYALLPDLYYRLGRLRFTPEDLRGTGRKRIFEAMRSLDNELVARDTGAMLSFLAEQRAAAPGPKGCIGYCMSGQYVVTVAGRFPDDFAAAASLYGVGIVTDRDDSPHLLAPKIRGELYLGFASEDPYVPEDVIPTLRSALDGSRVAYQLDVFPDTEHGFCFPQRDVYVESAAETVWERVLALYARTLR